MSGSIVSQALLDRFDTIRRTELDRLKKKLANLTEDERRSVESITAAIVNAIALVPARVLAEDAATPPLDAVVRLFALEHEVG